MSSVIDVLIDDPDSEQVAAGAQRARVDWWKRQAGRLTFVRADRGDEAGAPGPVELAERMRELCELPSLTPPGRP